jgi:DNA-binding transcriptional MerR regulator
MMGDFPDLMTTAEVAAMTRAPESTVRYWRYCGTGPASFRVGRRVLYQRYDVEHWLTALKQRDPSLGAG